MKPYTHRLQVRKLESPVVLVSAGSITLDIDGNYPHNFVGAVFFNDALGTTPVVPSGGTITIDIATVNQPQEFQAVNLGTVSVTAANQVSWSGNALQVRGTFNAVTGATHARLIYTGNQS